MNCSLDRIQFWRDGSNDPILSGRLPCLIFAAATMDVSANKYLLTKNGPGKFFPYIFDKDISR